MAIMPEGIPAEQCGMVDLPSLRLQMGGGEFCANACRAMGVLLALHSDRKDTRRDFTIRISGNSAPVRLSVCGSAPNWHVSAAFSLENTSLSNHAHSVRVDLPGISHLLLDAAFPEFEAVPSLAARLRKSHKLDSCPAAGIVWWRKEGDIFNILPHVHVPEAGTSMLETSCGSASLALALAMRSRSGESAFLVRQPGGDLLEITLDEHGQSATLSGEVSFCASGKIFIPEPATTV